MKHRLEITCRIRISPRAHFPNKKNGSQCRTYLVYMITNEKIKELALEIVLVSMDLAKKTYKTLDSTEDGNNCRYRFRSILAREYLLLGVLEWN
ncbi:hypothetical protein TNCV_4624141 [Trichonephila clavipes]|nr:hypothetical protein TNCV_4624141 [Trichonephila clavipes]